MGLHLSGSPSVLFKDQSSVLFYILVFIKVDEASPRFIIHAHSCTVIDSSPQMLEPDFEF